MGHCWRNWTGHETSCFVNNGHNFTVCTYHLYKYCPSIHIPEPKEGVLVFHQASWFIINVQFNLAQHAYLNHRRKNYQILITINKLILDKQEQWCKYDARKNEMNVVRDNPSIQSRSHLFFCFLPTFLSRRCTDSAYNLVRLVTVSLPQRSSKTCTPPRPGKPMCNGRHSAEKLLLRVVLQCKVCLVQHTSVRLL